MAEYVNGKELYAEMCVYHAAYVKTRLLGEERPPLTKKICEAIIQISNRLANSFNFVNYSYRDDMIQDGVLKSFAKIHLFDPHKSENVFAYVSQICWNQFITRIKTEHKQTAIRSRLIYETVTSEFFEQAMDNDVDTSNAFVEFLKEHDIFTDYLDTTQKRPMTGLLHPSLRHKNLSGYVKKDVPPDEIDDVTLVGLLEA